MDLAKMNQLKEDALQFGVELNEKQLFQWRAPGNTCLSALEHLELNTLRARNNSKGCGSVMRAAPIGFLNGYVYFRTTDVTGVVTLPEGVEMVMPGDNITMSIKLITEIAIEEGLHFAIREGGRTVGAGIVSSIIE